jgi:hypothetical protein
MSRNIVPIMCHIVGATRLLEARSVADDTHSSSSTRSSSTPSSSTPSTDEGGHDLCPCPPSPPSPHPYEKETTIPPPPDLPLPPNHPSSSTTDQAFVRK